MENLFTSPIHTVPHAAADARAQAVSRLIAQVTHYFQQHLRPGSRPPGRKPRPASSLPAGAAGR